MSMLNRTSLLAVVISTLALVAWGILFWGWVYDYFDIFNALPGQAQVLEALMASNTETGTYFFPWPRDTPEAFDSFVRQHRSGPFFQLSYIREGVDPQAPNKMLLGAGQYLLVSLLAALLVGLAARPTTSFTRKFLFVFLGGLMGTLFIRLGDPIWFHLPWPHAVGNAAYEVVAWALLGLVMAWVVRPR